MNYLVRNGKMKRSSGVPAFNFGIPAYKDKYGKITCPMAGSCGVDGGCYAQQKTYTWPVVKNAYQRRYEFTKKSYFPMVTIDEIKDRKIKRVRIHDSGDFYSSKYLRAWIHIAESCRDTQFYGYTKMVSLVKAKKIPKNMTLIFSYGGKQDHLINPETDRHSAVFETEAELLAAGYTDASHDDSLACGKSIKVGLIYHGAKSKAWKAKPAIGKVAA